MSVGTSSVLTLCSTFFMHCRRAMNIDTAQRVVAKSLSKSMSPPNPMSSGVLVASGVGIVEGTTLAYKAWGQGNGSLFWGVVFLVPSS